MRYLYEGEGFASLKQLAQTYSQDFLLEVFFKSYRIRLIEEAVAARYHQDEMKTPVHLAIGQEAIAVGTALVLNAQDLVYCSHRTHAVYLAKGGDLKAMLAEFHCRTTGCCGSRAGSMHLLDKKVGMAGSSAIVGGAIPIATGFALSAQQQNEKRLTAVYFGDAAVEEGVAWESINFAVLKKLPILYVCENNFYSVCSPLHYRQPEQVSIYQKAAAFGLKSECIDGNNVLAVYAAAQRAVEHLRHGWGPVFIEARTYRWLAHHGAEDDTPSGYRSAEEVNAWKAQDPIAWMKKLLLEELHVPAATLAHMQEKISQEIAEAFDFALQSPRPQRDSLMQHVYSEPKDVPYVVG